jgi:hypothetical protein
VNEKAHSFITLLENLKSFLNCITLTTTFKNKVALCVSPIHAEIKHFVCSLQFPQMVCEAMAIQANLVRDVKFVCGLLKKWGGEKNVTKCGTQAVNQLGSTFEKSSRPNIDIHETSYLHSAWDSWASGCSARSSLPSVKVCSGVHWQLKRMAH